MSHKAVRRLLLFLLGCFVALDQVYTKKDTIENTVYTSPVLQYWLMVFSGNWPGTYPQGIGKGGYAISVLIALCLGIGNFAAVITLLFKLPGFLNLKEAAMKLSQITSARDVAIKLALIRLLPEELVAQMKPLIDSAFEKGDSSWRRNTAIIHGNDALEAIREFSDKTTFKSRPSSPVL